MVERFGIQDHDPKQTQHALQNPTNPTAYQNLQGTDMPPPVYHPTGSSLPVLRLMFGVIRMLVMGGSLGRKSIPTAVILALIFGPFGLLYTSRIGAVVMTALTALAGYVKGGNINALESDAVMDPIWKCAVVASVVWTVLAARANNERFANPPSS